MELCLVFLTLVLQSVELLIQLLGSDFETSNETEASLAGVAGCYNRGELHSPLCRRWLASRRFTAKVPHHLHRHCSAVLNLSKQHLSTAPRPSTALHLSTVLHRTTLLSISLLLRMTLLLCTALQYYMTQLRQACYMYIYHSLLSFLSSSDLNQPSYNTYSYAHAPILLHSPPHSIGRGH